MLLGALMHILQLFCMFVVLGLIFGPFVAVFAVMIQGEW